MNEIMREGIEKDRRSAALLHVIYAMAVITAALVFFYFGYKTGASSDAAPASVQQTVAEAEEKNTYVVCAKNGKLCIYERSSKGESLIASERISMEVFPQTDRERLEKGLEFDTMAEAQALFEDFVN